jgi:hypothetical protein
LTKPTPDVYTPRLKEKLLVLLFYQHPVLLLR